MQKINVDELIIGKTQIYKDESLKKKVDGEESELVPIEEIAAGENVSIVKSGKTVTISADSEGGSMNLYSAPINGATIIADTSIVKSLDVSSYTADDGTVVIGGYSITEDANGQYTFTPPTAYNSGILKFVGMTADAPKPIAPYSLFTADGSQTVTLRFKLPTGSSILLDWGDGASETVTGEGSTEITVAKTYGATGGYVISVSGDYLELTHISCYNNQLIGNADVFSTLVNLTYLHCYGNRMAGSPNSLAALVNLSYLNLAVNQMTCPTIADWRGHNHDVQMQNNAFSTTETDNFIKTLASGDFVNQTLQLDGTNAAPSSAVDAELTALRAAGNTVTVSS